MKRISSLLCAGALAGLLGAAPVAAQVQDGQVFRQEGIASWYGPEFDGRPTASGEIFNSALFTAAHPTLPFGTVLSITNTHNNKKVSVRVNDRGPFVSARILDVSQAAAEQLDMLVTGTAPVIVESVGPVVFPSGTAPETAPAAASAPGDGSGLVDPDWTTAQAEPGVPANTAPAAPENDQFVQPPPQPAAPAPQPAALQQPPAAVQPAPPQPPPPAPQPAPPPQPAASQARPMPAVPESGRAAPSAPAVLRPAVPPAPNKVYRLQVGSYRIARNAVDAFERLKNAGLNPAYERNGEFFRVVLPGVRGEDVPSVAEKLGAAGFAEALLREEP